MADGPSPTLRLPVSVVIPVKDDADHLRRCLRALALQSRLPDEVLVIDNGSTDDSAAVATAAGARVLPCPHPGIPAAAATGYDAAAHPLILRLDADCVPARTWVESLAGAAERRPGVAAFVGSARFVDGPRALRRSLALLYLGAYGLALLPTLGHLPLFGSNLALRRSAWRTVRRSVHSRRTDIHDDLDLAFHIGDRHRIAYVPDAAMGISMRPFSSRRDFLRRIHRGARTVILHWPADFPPVRWVKRTLRRPHRVPSEDPAFIVESEASGDRAARRRAAVRRLPS